MVNSSLGYEILLYLNSFYFGMFVFCEFGMGILKAINLPYPEDTLSTEAIFLLTLCFVEALRIILGRKGNLTEHSIPVCCSIMLTFPSAMGVAYFMVLQTFILRLEYILCAILLTLQAMELLFGLVFLINMCKPQSY